MDHYTNRYDDAATATFFWIAIAYVRRIETGGPDWKAYGRSAGPPRPYALSKVVTFKGQGSQFLDLVLHTERLTERPALVIAHAVLSPGAMAVLRGPTWNGLNLPTSLGTKPRIRRLAPYSYIVMLLRVKSRNSLTQDHIKHNSIRLIDLVAPASVEPPRGSSWIPARRANRQIVRRDNHRRRTQAFNEKKSREIQLSKFSS